MILQKCIILVYIVFTTMFSNTRSEDLDAEEDSQEVFDSREIEGNFDDILLIFSQPGQKFTYFT